MSKWESIYPEISQKFVIDLNNKEFYLAEEEGGLIRYLNGINAHIYYSEGLQKKKLVEDKQIFTDISGAQRELVRGFEYLAEKIKMGEEPELALKRGIQEELNIPPEGYTYEFTNELQEEKESPYHPGLKTKYVFYVYQVNLKKEFYNELGYVEVEPKRSTYFVWKNL